ncbi:TetR/AcrR family transcriptional regulator [Microtetraspora glauca]|uniref:TetR/AcrR family transcriptional regulator n=1 Tax=Microtetraspora glauca TaxID=1996 RepID=A0ABV3GR24_MICGL
MTYQGSEPHEGAQSDLVVNAATRLFAALGYDGTTLHHIAEASGLDLATLGTVAGSKRDIYLAVLDLAFRRHRAMLEESVREFRETGSVHALLERYLDFCLEYPDNLALWMHRWLADAVDVTDFEQRYVQPVIVVVGDLLRDSLARCDSDVDIDIEFSIWTVIWCAHGFVRGGFIGPDGLLRRASDPQTLRRFRRHMHRLWHRQLCLPGEPPAEYLL